MLGTFVKECYRAEMKARKPYPTDVSDEEWSFAAPYLTLMTKDAPQRRYELREMFNALRWIVRARRRFDGESGEGDPARGGCWPDTATDAFCRPCRWF